MGMRETISYNKDLITGITDTMLKNKPDDAPMVNTTTVQLFDASTGEKVYEAVSENIINNNIARLAYMNHFYNQIKNSYTNGYGPFGIISFTDYVGAEDSDDWLYKGKLIGWSDKGSYAGGDPVRGTCNSIESNTTESETDGFLHYVFDFPTHAANGTFQTVWWTRDTNFCSLENTRTLGCEFQWNYGARSVFTKEGFVVPHNPTMNNTLPLYLYSDTLHLVKIASFIPINIPAMIMFGIACDDLNVYTIDSNTKRLHKFSDTMREWLSFTDIIGWDNAWGDVSECDIKDGIIYALTSNFYVVKLDVATSTCISGTSIRTIVGVSPTGTQTSWGITFDNLGRIITYNNVISADLTTRIGVYTGCYGYSIKWNKKSNTLTQIIPGGIGVSNHAYAAYGAQNLLAAPITKTSAFTMKIIYDFQIDKLY